MILKSEKLFFSSLTQQAKPNGFRNLWIARFSVCTVLPPPFSLLQVQPKRCPHVAAGPVSAQHGPVQPDLVRVAGQVSKGSFCYSTHLLHTFYLFIVWNGCVSSAVNLTRFLNLYPEQVGLTAGENRIFWALSRLSAACKKEKHWALQLCPQAMPLFLTLPLARLSAWPLLKCGAFNKWREKSNFILSMWVIHVLKGDKNVIRKFSCQMSGKWNQFINAVKPMCEIGIKGEVWSHPCACCSRTRCHTKASCPQKVGAAVVTTSTGSKQTNIFFSSDAIGSVGVRDVESERADLNHEPSSCCLNLCNVVRTPLKTLLFFPEVKASSSFRAIIYFITH